MLREYATKALINASAADVLTTYLGLQAGLVETNGVAVALMDVAGPFGLIALKLVALLVTFVMVSFLPNERLQSVMLCIPAAIWGGAAVWNASLFLT